MTSKKVIADVDRARAALAKAETNLGDVRKRRKIGCSCGKKHAIGTLELLITHWYVSPYGCTDGDYWNEGEWQFVCPSSGARNRLMFDDYSVKYEDRGKVSVAAEPTFKRIYRGLFASRRDVYKDDDPTKLHFNNDYVDNRRKLFELPEKPK